MERELSLLKKELAGSPHVEFQPAFHTIGMGPESAYRNMTSVLEAASSPVRPQAVLLCGFAGAVDPSVNTGDLIVSSRYCREKTNSIHDDHGLVAGCLDGLDYPDHFEPDPDLFQAACEAAQGSAHRSTPNLFLNPSLTVSGLIGSSSAKQAIWDRYHVSSVNMEDYWAAAAAKKAGVPFVSVRAVLDVAHQGLPDYLSSISHPGSGALRSTIMRPWRIPTLLTLASQMSRAQNSLALFGLSFIRRFCSVSAIDPGDSSAVIPEAITGIPGAGQ
ncbi:MAG: hypothetical protein BZY88_14570 [SAR202 cluster bacterium Io17-Chloro-G9]|nr:MAG: hypothetical protein BZY88_14570 [SAR202 cluster bacterium Io17-Chloro-G9]